MKNRTIFAWLVMLFISTALFSADFSCRWVIDEVIEEIGAIDEITLELCGKEYKSVDDLWAHIWEDHIVPQKPQKATCRWLLEDGVCNLETTRNNIRRHIFNINQTHLSNVEKKQPVKKVRPKRSAVVKKEAQKMLQQEPEYQEESEEDTDQELDIEAIYLKEYEYDLQLIREYEEKNYGKKKKACPERPGIRTIEKGGIKYYVTPDRLLFYCDKCNLPFVFGEDYFDHIHLHGWVKRELFRKYDNTIYEYFDEGADSDYSDNEKNDDEVTVGIKEILKGTAA